MYELRKLDEYAKNDFAYGKDGEAVRPAHTNAELPRKASRVIRHAQQDGPHQTRVCGPRRGQFWRAYDCLMNGLEAFTPLRPNEGGQAKAHAQPLHFPIFFPSFKPFSGTMKEL